MQRTVEIPGPQTTIYDRNPGLKEKIQDGYAETVLFIPDGNGRWAEKHGLTVSEGHMEGAKAMAKFLPAFVELPSKTFIPWAFSYDNWTRPQEERDGIMRALQFTVENYFSFFEKNKIRFIRLGREDRIRKYYPHLWSTLSDAEHMTKDYENKIVAVPLDFNGTDQVVRMMNRFGQLVKSGQIDPNVEITPEMAEKLRDGEGIIKPADAIIRTSGEQRTSDLGWLNTNSEFFTIPKLLPDCNEADLLGPFFQYPDRKRRFGGRPDVTSGTLPSRV